MPAVLRIGPYRFGFWAADRHEPPHIHVERDRATAKFWLDPPRLANNHGFGAAELRKVRRLVEENEAALLQEWHDFFRRAN
jgi:uncharacterized protein DUF4160